MHTHNHEHKESGHEEHDDPLAVATLRPHHFETRDCLPICPNAVVGDRVGSGGFRRRGHGRTAGIGAAGSFFIGGRTIQTEDAGWGSFREVFGESFEAGKITVEQMYVQFQVPVKPSHTPIVFMHGGLLSSKQWETTPDGRMGWFEYFTRKGFPTYLAEQSGRARSGFNPSAFNEVGRGKISPSKQPRIYLGTSDMAWKVFRFGPREGQPYPGQQFPLDRVDEFYKQVIPDMFETEVPSLMTELITPTTDNPTVENVADLANQLGGAILVGHSQSSGFPTQAVLKAKGGIKGIIQLETGCFANLTDQQIGLLAKIPMLVMVGDYLGEHPSASCDKEIAQVQGPAETSHLFRFRAAACTGTATCSCRTRTISTSQTSS
ncbi:hypothetical protein HGP17_11425 [Rhizobium sp. P38BS-XIX]|uniref:hypothetical protein n=1 Tax=Rhizobium sp. P38BS-XIX TaxID=2726740 RepID=UPI001456A027|nr:hypothetical protein [Rhizobium sp. P38BS-XIX]NLR97431.1 hypothetical protein [Rhizobium sp. P38BS-XIX]